ncbi:MAG: SAM hydrolase/SAM-dependent halogenase family protein [Ilyomonas sp.]
MQILTLTTDIGQNDYIIGAIKGQLLTANSALNIVDISHSLSPFNFQQAAYICKNAYKHFPPDTFHVVIVNLFETSPSDILIARYNDQFIACPDNGILTMITGSKPNNIVSIKTTTNKNLDTLQYTQALANSIAYLSNHKNIYDIGLPVDTIEEKYPLRSTMGSDWIEGQIIFIDNFENVVVNITKEEFEQQRKGRSFKIVFTRNETISSISKNYASTSPGEKLAWFNSAGYLEMAINKGNMAGLFGLQGISDTPQDASFHNKYFYQTVRIFFE